jgi:uncharacterized membrane protein YcaP (DUF421 family)
MSGWFDLDWQRMFVPHVPIMETVIRGSIMYLVLFCLLRVFRRQTGSLGPADLLVLLLIADASQNGMADEYKSITEGIVLVATIIAWEYFIDWLAFRVPQVGQLVERPPLLLIRDGALIDANLTKELITRDDLLSQLRQKGVDDPAQVRLCFLESDGHVSVITADSSRNGSQQSSRSSGAH